MFHLRQRVGPQAGFFGIGFHQCHLLVAAAREAQVIQCLLVDGEHGRSRAIFRRHVGNGGAVTDGERGGALAVELKIGADHLFLAQEFGQGQHDVGGGDARLTATRKLDTDDVGQAHPRRAAQHDVLGLEATHAHGDHAQCIHMRRV